jgi:hypothetical protein
MTSPHIDTVRQQLIDTLADLRNRDKPMEVDRALAVAKVAGVLVDTARVEVEFLKATNGDSSSFLQRPEDALPPGINSITRHRLAG